MSALLRGRSAICRILPVIGRSRIVHGHNLIFEISKITSVPNPCLRNARNCANFSESPRTVRESFPRPFLATLPKNVDQALNLIDREVRRVGRIRKDIVMRTYQTLQETGTVTEHQSLLLLRCLGTVMVDESPAVRNKLAEELWSGLKTLGAKYDVRHYNALLGVYLQNEHTFSPSEFLGTMEAEGVAPIRLTYQRLISGYCQTGDIAGASQILEHMKNTNLPINEAVFNSLLMGHMRTGDSESAIGMLKIMRESGIPPSGETYSTLMKEYALKGDIESIEKTSADAVQADVSFYPSHYFDVVQALCSSGYEQHVDRALGLYTKSQTSWYNQDCMNITLQMVARGFDDVAHKLFLSMNHPMLHDQSDVTLGRFFLKSMVKHERPIENVVRILKDLSSRGLNSDRVDFIAQWALVYEKPDYALETFDLMAKEELQVRTHYFWPVFIAYKNQKNAEGIYRAIEIMEKKVNKSSEFQHTLQEYILPSLIEAGESVDSINERLTAIGMREGDVNFAYLIDLMKEGRYEQALDLVRDKEIQYYPVTMKPYLLDWLHQTGGPEAVLEVISQAHESPSGGAFFNLADVTNTFLFNTANILKNDKTKLESIVQTMVEKKVGIRSDDDALLEKMKAIGVSSTLMEELLSIEVVPTQKPERGAGRGQFDQLQYSSMSIDELEKTVATNRANDSNIKGPMKWLLEKHCAEGNVSRTDEIKSELDGLGFIYSPETIRSLLHLATTHKNDLVEANKYMDMLKNDFTEFNAYVNEVIDLAVLYASQGNFEVAVSNLRDYSSRHQKYMTNKGYADSYLHEEHCKNLVRHCHKSENPGEILSTLFECGYIKTGCFSILTEYVQGYLDNDDINGAIEAMTYCNKMYRRTPRVQDIFKILIEKEDPVKLQEVMDIASSSLGEMQALHQLLFGFVACGKEKQAKRIMETPGMRAMNGLLEMHGNALISAKKIKELESLVNITKGLFGLDREQMLFILMKGYCIMDDMDNALNVLQIMEEDNLTPRARTLRYIGNTLKSKNMDVPFEIPEIPLSAQTQAQQTPKQTRQMQKEPLSVSDATPPPVANLTPSEMAIVQQAAAGNIDSLKDMNSLKESVGGTFRAEFVGEVASSLLKAGKNLAAKILLKDLASLGEVDILEELVKTKIPRQHMQGMLYTALSLAYLESGATEKFLDLIRSRGGKVNSDVCRTFAEKYPDRLHELDNLIQTIGGGTSDTLNALWQIYFTKEDFNKASELLKKYPDFARSLRISPACNHAKKNNRILGSLPLVTAPKPLTHYVPFAVVHKYAQEDLLQFLIDVTKGNRSNQAFAYSYMLGLKCDTNDWQGALNVLEKVKNDGFTTDDLRPLPLVNLESLLVAHSQNVPWPIGKYGVAKKASVDSSSSSSSSSSSDSDTDETTAKPSVSL